ncbi:uncharacterized protein METZ01_LOCUS325496, partial [marine metagenome]
MTSRGTVWRVIGGRSTLADLWSDWTREDDG